MSRPGRSAGRRGTGLLRLLLATIAPLVALPLGAQAPHLEWRTIPTEHFRIHFNPALEPLARRVAAGAERAYRQLSAELAPPRGMIDVVVSDDVDFSNGSATPVPTNRIVLYATPPVDETALRYTNDWAQMVLVHELVHIFHLDRTRGVWALAQRVFGRSPFLFPNAYSPAWFTEGLAVYYESRIAGAGRIDAPEHHLIARAAAIDHRLPALGDVSLATPTYPFGLAAYAYGSLLVDHLARTRGHERLRDFVDRAAAQPIPYLIDIPARSAFGISFSRAWRQWRDSVEGAVRGLAINPLPEWRDLTRDGVIVSSPRWATDTTLLYAGSSGRDVFGAYRVSLAGDRERVGRRNSASPQVTLSDGGILFSQLEYTNPYQQRSDLYVQRGDDEIRLTRGARLAQPDVRADGEIVAVQNIGGGTRLVRVAPDGAQIRELAPGSLDVHWTEPRWSRSGTQVAAVRMTRGGVAQLVVLDQDGDQVHTVASGRVILSTPSWLPGDRGVMFSMGTERSTDVYVQMFGSPATSFRVSRSASGLFEPEPGPDALVAAVALQGDGYHLGVGRPGALEPVELPRSEDPDPRTGPVAVDSTPARRYSGLWGMIPRYWIPSIEPGFASGQYRLGATTYGYDVLERHYLSAYLAIPTDNTGVAGSASYRWSGLGVPQFIVAGSQDWSLYRTIVSRDAPRRIVGDVRRRIRDGNLSVLAQRQRARTGAAVQLTGGVERREYLSVPAGLLTAIDDSNRFRPATFPYLLAAVSYARYQSPPFAISLEDGFTLNVTARERFRSGFTGSGGASASVVSSVAGYKALDLPGYAHHVLAVRVAGGWADTRAPGYFEVGGTSGSAFEIVPGIAIGEGRRTFGVRGFVPGTLVGVHAFSTTAEYRAPLLLGLRSLGILPFFLQKSSITAFADWGGAWCPDWAAPATGRQVCVDPSQTRQLSIASAGAELNVNAGLLTWDKPFRFRLGVAVPVRGGETFGARRVSGYLTSGVSF